MTEDVSPRKPGRPSAAEVDARHPKHKMKAKPNWEDMNPVDESETPDRLRIAPELIPDGMALQWVTDSVYGQDMSQHRSTFEKRGWTPVHQADFDGAYNGMFMPRGAEGEIKVDGLVLMARPKELTERAKKADLRRAREQVAIKEQALRGGDMPNISLDTRHETALRQNRVNKTVERIEIPSE